MIRRLEDRKDAIAAICRRFGVRRLEVFGSAADGTFDPKRSDVDLLVEYFPGVDLGPWLARYFDLKEELEALLGCPVDLVMPDAASMENPYFARAVNRSRRPLYAA